MGRLTGNLSRSTKCRFVLKLLLSSSDSRFPGHPHGGQEPRKSMAWRL